MLGTATTNEGTVEATNGGLLEVIGLDSTLTQNQGGSGNLVADGAGSIVELFGSTVVGGTLTTTMAASSRA